MTEVTLKEHIAALMRADDRRHEQRFIGVETVATQAKSEARALSERVAKIEERLDRHEGEQAGGTAKADITRANLALLIALLAVLVSLFGAARWGPWA